MIRDEKADIVPGTMEIQRIIRSYCEQLHSNKCDNMEEMNKFLDTYNLPTLNQEYLSRQQ